MTKRNVLQKISIYSSISCEYVKLIYWSNDFSPESGMQQELICSNGRLLIDYIYQEKDARNALPLEWRQNERDGVSNHQPHDCLLKR